MPDNKVLTVSAGQARTMGSILTGQGQPDDYNLSVGKRMLRGVWLADTWPTWPYFVDDPDGRFGDAREAIRARELRAALETE